MNLSKQSRQHLMQQSKPLVKALFPEASCTFFATYSKMKRIIQTTAINKEPRAIEPKWYLGIQKKPFQTSASPGMPSESGIVLSEKYQLAAAQTMTNSLHERINAIIQKYPKIIIQSMLAVPAE